MISFIPVDKTSAQVEARWSFADKLLILPNSTLTCHQRKSTGASNDINNGSIMLHSAEWEEQKKHSLF